MIYDKVEVDLLIKCNLSCFGCNRASSRHLAPSDEELTIDQLKRFLKETVDINYKWEFIRLLGGEPLLRNDLLEIVNLVKPHCSYISLSTNGMVNKKLIKRFESIGIVVGNSNKSINDNPNKFYKMYEAPIDIGEYNGADEICILQTECGLGFNRYGYYPCGIASNIDRVFGFDIGIKSLKDVNDESIQKQKDILCRYCGKLNSLFKERIYLDKEYMSESWIKVFKKYKEDPPKLSLY